jgi:murein DD-endopeptidase MepM/ murein hydrolase activator NlpD
LVTGTLVPDMSEPDSLALVDANAAAAEAAQRTQAEPDRASRSDARSDTPAVTAEQVAPDLWVLPLREYTLTSKFGPRWGRSHKGIDLGASEGTPYHSVARGKVILARYYGGYGNCIMIQHDDNTVSLYGHSSKMLVKEGQIVEAGELIGKVGNTGYSFGAHLHLEIRINDEQTDPIPWLKAKGADVPTKTDPLSQG